MRNVLSLFDGMSCGQIALKELGIEYDKYYSSEIDKFAIKQTQHNFPDTIQLGDINDWRDWGIDWSNIDLILAGSPCQGFSMMGKQLAFDDEKSRLYFVFEDILTFVKGINPKVKFLLENVKMSKVNSDIITERLGVQPILINSALVSAQNRVRLYWSNIEDITQPDDRGLFLRDVLENEVDEKYYLSEKMIAYLQRSTIRRKRKFTIVNINKKSKCIRTSLHRTDLDSDIVSKSNCLISRQGVIECSYIFDGKLRKLTPTECARLQTIPDWYEWVVSDTQAYKMLGNGWTVEVIKHLLKYYKKHDNDKSNN